MNTKRAPKVRFKGFTDAWELRKLPEFVNFYSGLTYTPDNVQESGTLVLRSSNVKNGEIIDADNVYVNIDIVNSENVQDGDIIVVIRNGSRALIGKHAQIKGFRSNTVIGAFMTGIRSEHPAFVNALLDTPAFEIEIAKNLGATINQITGYMFSKMEFAIPSSKEQIEIGKFFFNLDNLITLHQRKLDKMKELKKTFLNLIFSQKLRFRGFTDSWELRKLGEITEKITRKNQSLESLLPLTISAQHGLIDQNSFFNKQIASKDVSGYYLIKNGEFAYNKSYSNAYPWGAIKRLDLHDKGVLSTLYIVFKPTNVESNFLVSYYSADNWHKEVSIRAAEGARNHGLLNISPQDFFETKLLIPNKYEEQEKIGVFFKKLDNLIIFNQDKINRLKNVKKILLKNMLI